VPSPLQHNEPVLCCNDNLFHLGSYRSHCKGSCLITICPAKDAAWPAASVHALDILMPRSPPGNNAVGRRQYMVSTRRFRQQIHTTGSLDVHTSLLAGGRLWACLTSEHGLFLLAACLIVCVGMKRCPAQSVGYQRCRKAICITCCPLQ
jgi:hypothetical protein